MKKLLISFALAPVLMAFSCGGQERIVLTPVAQPCVTGDPPAAPEKVAGKLTGDAGRDLGIIAGSLVETRAWGEMLYNMLKACSQ